MNTQNYIDAMEELLDKAWNVPLSNGKCMVDADALSELMGNIRESLPVELRQAKAIVADRTEIVASARREAESILRAAEDRAKLMVSHEEILKEATSQAAAILSSANQKARETRQGANDYAEGVMHRLLEVIGQAGSEVKSAQQNFRSSQKAGQ